MTVRYDLGPAELSEVTAEFLAGHPGAGEFVSVVVGPDDPLADVGRSIERQVFEQSFGNDATVMSAEYGPYETRSLFFVVLDRRRGAPAGVARVIAGGAHEMKTIVDALPYLGLGVDEIVAAHGLHEGSVWEFATIAVLPEYRGGRASLAVSSLIYRTFLRAGRQAGVRHVVAMLDRGGYRNLRLLGVRLVALAGSEPFAYLGSAETRAVYADFPEIEPSIAAQAIRLRRSSRLRAIRFTPRGLRKLLLRRFAAGISRRVSSGHGLDQNIVLPS
jgi:N-acyl-L-homoserine lactone synthetase